MSTPEPQYFRARARKLLEQDGYKVLSERAHRALLTRVHVAESVAEHADEYRASTETWARGICAEERRLRDRVTYLYGVARAHGATDEELHRQPEFLDAAPLEGHDDHT
jgi:hypothetical protein